MSEKIHECPQCGRPFSKLSNDGKIGFCKYHDKWFACEPSAEAQAFKANEEYADEKRQAQQKKLAAQKKAETAQKTRERASIGAKVLAVVVVLAAIALAVFWFAIRPRMNYSQANTLLAQGSYEQARTRFQALNGYSDSAAKVKLCDAFIALQNNDINTALESLEEVEAGGSGLSDGLKISICDTVANWQQHGISPEGLLTLLARAGDFDPNGTLDLEALSTQAHIALASDAATVDTYVADVNGDGEQNIVMLKDDYSVVAYRMQEKGNAKVTLDRTMTEACLLQFGDRFAARDAEKAMACYQAAYAANPSAASAAKLGAACQARATASEAKEDYESALADAAYALEIMDTKKAYSFYYEMMLRRCYAEADSAEGIRLWDEFAQDTALAAQKFNMRDEILARSAELRLARAEELASAKDPACLDLLREARERGADIYETLEKAIERSDLNLTRVRLRQLAQEVCAEDADKLGEQTDLLTGDLREALNSWQSLGLAPQEVFSLLAVPETAAAGVDTAKVYRDAALAAASAEEKPVAHVFFDWNGDGAEELLTLYAEGALRVYAMKAGGLSTAWSDSVDFPAGALTLAGEKLVVCEAADQSGFAVYAYGGGKLAKRVAASGLQVYARTDEAIDYGMLLDGSIERYMRYRYDLASAPEAAELVELDWQQDDYPLPETAEAAVIRYFEALCYGVQEEATLLASPVAYSDGAFPEGFAAAPRPDDAAITATPYEKDKDSALFEVTYTSGGAAQRMYAAAVKDGSWKVAGVAASFTNAAALPETLGGQLIPLNEDVKDQLNDADDQRVYRFLLSGKTELQLVWQAGEKDNDRESFRVNLYRAADLENPIAAYTYKLARKKQTGNPLFLTPGVYYAAVFPARYQDCGFTLKLQATRSEYLEAEPNNSLAQANPIALNQDYAAGLSDKADIDIFAFTLNEASAVRAVLSAEAGTSRQSRYVFALAEKATAKVLTRGALGGQEKQSATESVYLAPGDYVVQVQKGDGWTAGEYRLRIEAEAAANSEIESNDTPETATPISVNEEYVGTIAKEGDVDHFAFTLEGDAVVQPHFSFDAVESGSKTYVITLQQDGKDIVSYPVGGKETQKTFMPFPLRAGSYTVKVENPRFAAQGYKLTVVSQAMERVEQEPNDALAQATALESGAPVAGLLFSADDVDTYRVTLAGDSILSLNFAFAPGTASGSVFALSLEKNGKAVSKWDVTAESGGLDSAVQLPAGDYDLIVRSGANWTGAIYTVNASVSPVQTVAVGGEAFGSLTRAGDVNAIHFSLTDYAEIAPTLSLNGGTSLKLLKSGEKNALETATLSADKAAEYRPVWRLGAGEYYIHLTAADGPVDYALQLGTAEAPAAQPGAPYTGALLGPDDLAAWKLAFTETTNVTITLSFEEIPSADEAFHISLDKGQQELWSDAVPGNAGEYTITLKVPTGEYLLHLTCAERMAGAVYTLTIGY